MSTTDQLTSTIFSQRQTVTATDNFPSVVMDSTAYTMDDPRAYMGNQTVNSFDIPIKVRITTPKTTIVSPRF